MTSSIDREILKLHNGTGTECVVCLEITCKSWYGRYYHKHLILFASPSCANYAINYGLADLVLDRFLLIRGCRDEELILDVYKMLTVCDDVDVGVRNRMLFNS